MATSIQITALDGIVNVNSLFTLAVFLGLAWNPTDPNTTLIQNPTCLPGPHISSKLISYQIYSFSSFLFSSLVALALKQTIRITKSPGYSPPNLRTLHVTPDLFGHVSRELLRIGMLVSGIGSACGSIFLMLALVNLAQFKLGVFGCGNSGHTAAAVVPLVIFVPLGLLVYVCVVLYAFTR